MHTHTHKVAYVLGIYTYNVLDIYAVLRNAILNYMRSRYNNMLFMKKIKIYGQKRIIPFCG